MLAQGPNRFYWIFILVQLIRMDGVTRSMWSNLYLSNNKYKHNVHNDSFHSYNFSCLCWTHQFKICHEGGKTSTEKKIGTKYVLFWAPNNVTCQHFSLYEIVTCFRYCNSTILSRLQKKKNTRGLHFPL